MKKIEGKFRNNFTASFHKNFLNSNINLKTIYHPHNNTFAMKLINFDNQKRISKDTSSKNTPFNLFPSTEIRNLIWRNVIEKIPVCEVCAEIKNYIRDLVFLIQYNLYYYRSLIHQSHKPHKIIIPNGQSIVTSQVLMNIRQFEQYILNYVFNSFNIPINNNQTLQMQLPTKVTIKFLNKYKPSL